MDWRTADRIAKWFLGRKRQKELLRLDPGYYDDIRYEIVTEMSWDGWNGRIYGLLRVGTHYSSSIRGSEIRYIVAGPLRRGCPKKADLVRALLKEFSGGKSLEELALEMEAAGGDS